MSRLFKSVATRAVACAMAPQMGCSLDLKQSRPAPGFFSSSNDKIAQEDTADSMMHRTIQVYESVKSRVANFKMIPVTSKQLEADAKEFVERLQML